MFEKILDFLLSPIIYDDEPIDDHGSDAVFQSFCKDFKGCLNNSICSSTRVAECDSWDMEKKELYLEYRGNVGKVDQYCTKFWAIPGSLNDVNKHLFKYKKCEKIKEISTYPADENNLIWFVDIWYKRHELKFKLIPNTESHHREAVLKLIKIKRKK